MPHMHLGHLKLKSIHVHLDLLIFSYPVVPSLLYLLNFIPSDSKLFRTDSLSALLLTCCLFSYLSYLHCCILMLNFIPSVGKLY